MSGLQAEEVRQVAELQKEDGRCHLLKLLKWEAFDEEENLKPGILLDYLYNTIVFATEKGFPWPSVALAVCFAEQLLCETKGKSIQEAFRKLRDKCEEYQHYLNPNYLLHLVNYLSGTFFKHYRLYQFLLCETREIDQTIYNLEVHIPQEVPILKDGVDAELWKYEKLMAELNEAEDQLRAKMSAFRKTVQLKSEQELEKFYKNLRFRDKEALERANLEKIIKEACDIQMTATSEILQKDIETSFEILNLEVQKATIPVPVSKSVHLSKIKETRSGIMKRKK